MNSLPELLEYDAWAYARWSGLKDAPIRAEITDVLAHVDGTVSGWQSRIPESLRSPIPAQAHEDSRRFWTDIANGDGLQVEFEWERKSTGERFTNSVAEVLVHLGSHGTYHYGHLRGLAEARGWEGFLDTDYCHFFIQRNPSGPTPEMHLLEARFGHDQWGWRRWMDCDLASSPVLVRRRSEILEHHLGCYRGWGEGVAEVLGVSGPKVDGSPLEQLESLSRWWRGQLAEYGPYFQVEYKDRFSTTLGRIALHVANHGHYHRGHLRGLAEANDVIHWPDTDYILYAARA